MSEGFWAYRDLDRRLRCLAHLIRKAQALEDGFERAAQPFGTQVPSVIATVIRTVYEARAAPPPAGALRARHSPMLNALLDECLRQVDASHEKTRALARELLNDWDTFVRHEVAPVFIKDDPMFCHRYPTGPCVRGNPGVRSVRDNVAAAPGAGERAARDACDCQPRDGQAPGLKGMANRCEPPSRRRYPSVQEADGPDQRYAVKSGSRRFSSRRRCTAGAKG
jgi:hypothetical protein